MAGIFPNLGVLCSKRFPTEIRATSTGIVRALSYVALLGNYKLYPMALKSFGLYHVVYLYASITAAFTLWVSLVIRNTDRLSLIEIQDMHEKTEVNVNVVEIEVHQTNLGKSSALGGSETKGKEETFQGFSNAVEMVENAHARRKSVFENWKPSSNPGKNKEETDGTRDILEGNANTMEEKADGYGHQKKSDWKTIINAIDVR